MASYSGGCPKTDPHRYVIASGVEVGADDDVDLDELAGEEQGLGANGGAGRAVLTEVLQVRGGDGIVVFAQVHDEDGVLHDLVAGDAEVVEHLIEVGEGLLDLSIEVVRVDEVAFIVVRQLPGHVDCLVNLDRLSEPELALAGHVVTVGLDGRYGGLLL